jgi:hypothetical protein
MLFRQDPQITLVSIGNLGVNVDADSGFDMEEQYYCFCITKVNNVTGIILLTR